jgi:dTDP-4-amino-4,6-dideoxygalactose transaminase
LRTDYLIFGSPLIEEDEIAEVVSTLRSGWIGTGPKAREFEKEFESYVGCRHAISVGSCTAALHLSMLVSGIESGDEVITTPLTFCATVNAILHAGAQPRFVDIDRATMNIDPAKIEAAIGPRTKALLPVHFAGRPCAMDAITDIARRHNLLVIEDAAHAIEANTVTGKVGAIGDLTCFSFYVTKNLVTGEGGMITTDRDDWAQRLRTYALHGLSRDAWKRYSDDGYKTYKVEFPGYKYNMTDIQASLGIPQLAKIDKRHRRREEIWARYDASFADLPVTTPPTAEPGTVHARHLYTLLLASDVLRDEFQRSLHEANIGTGIHYNCVHLEPYYREEFQFARGDFPDAEYISDRTLSLPMGPKLSDDDVGDVIEAVRQALA